MPRGLHAAPSHQCDLGMSPADSLGLHVAVCLLMENVVTNMYGVTFMSLPAQIDNITAMLVNAVVCVCFCSGSRACSSRESRKCWKWKFLWLPNPTAEVRKSFQTSADA